MKIEQGYLYKAKNTVICKPSSFSKEKRRIVVEKNEIIEFRYWHPCNFRTIDNLYLNVEEEVFRESFEIYAQIIPEISFRNQNSLKQILDCSLYDLIEVSKDE